MNLVLPMAGVELNPLLLALLGFTVGVCGGFMGMGGAFMVTPVLNLIGFPMAYAIGTDIAHISGKSIVATLRHRKLGHVDFRLGAITTAGALGGMEMGKRLVLALEETGSLERTVGIAYVLVLTSISGYMFYEYLVLGRARQKEPAGAVQDRPPALALAVRAIKLPPYVSLPTARVESISVWVLLAIGLLVGFVAGSLGVGGGFLLLPAYVYLVGAPTAVAVGTDLFTIAISSGYGAFTYSLSDRVDLLAAIVMLLGAAPGVQLGAFATRYADGRRIRLVFASTLILAATGVGLNQLADSPGASGLSTLAVVVIIGAALVLSSVIIATAARGLSSRRRAADEVARWVEAPSSYGPWHQGAPEREETEEERRRDIEGVVPVWARLY